MKRFSICLAVTAALALPAAAGAAEKFYGGKINNGGKIGIDVTTLNGEPFEINGMAYRNVSAKCNGNPSTIRADYIFDNFFVENRRFEVDDNSGPDRLLFKGRFVRGDRRIEGALKEGPSEFEPGVTCESPKRGYFARRNADGPHPNLRPKVAKAVRVAP
jgi:hypothetical protein